MIDIQLLDQWNKGDEMSNKKNGPILLTGSHRSGSTWVGKMIAHSPSVAYIHEPFNVNHGPGICSAQFKNWFTYVCAQNELAYYNELRNCFDFKYQLLDELKTVKSMKHLAQSARDYVLFTNNRILKKRPLIKDPIAIFSAEWLAKTFYMDVVIIIRHPAAFAGSLKKPNWIHPFKHFLNQPLLMQHHLHDFQGEIEEFSKTNKDIVDQAILLWNLIHYMILKYKEDHPKWIFVKHEELSKNPEEEFGKLYEKLGLSYSTKISEKIAGFSRPHSNEKYLESALKRDSKSNILSWKTRLTADEIIRVKANTHKVASQFYREEDWL